MHAAPTTDLSIRSEDLYRQAREVMPGGCSRATIFFPPHPIYARSAQGCVVTDVDGVERIDFVNNMSSLIHGHNHPEINDAVKRQIDQLTAAAMPTESEIRLAQELCSRLASVEQVIFTNSGTEAVMMAIRAARAFTGRSAIAKAEGAYHGAYDFVDISVGASPETWGSAQAPNAVGDTKGIPGYASDDVVVLPYNDLASTEELIEANRHRLAGVVIDPVVSRAGLIRGRPEYLKRIREMCDAYGIVLIFDEVLSFRLGYGGAQGQCGIRPDLTALGKIIGGGFPVGAVGGSRDVMSVFDVTRPKPPVPHGGTYNANPVTMTAGLATLELLPPEAYDRLAALGARARDHFTAGMAEAKLDGFVRADGSLFSVFFGGQDADRYRELPRSPRQTEMQQFLHRQLLDLGFICTPFSAFILSTVMTEHEIDALGDAAARCFVKMKQRFG